MQQNCRNVISKLTLEKCCNSKIPLQEEYKIFSKTFLLKNADLKKMYFVGQEKFRRSLLIENTKIAMRLNCKCFKFLTIYIATHLNCKSSNLQSVFLYFTFFRFDKINLPCFFINRKYLELLDKFYDEIAELRDRYNEDRQTCPVPRNMPPVAGRIFWIRQLYKRIEEPMETFKV